MAEWIAEGEPSSTSGTWTSAASAHQYRSPAYTHARIQETYETYYDIRYPNHERQAGRPLRVSPGQRLAPRARRGLRREVGLGAGQLVRVERGARATSRCGRAAGPGQHWSPAIGAEHLRRRARRSAIFDESLVREARDRGAGRGRASSSASATTRSPARSGKITYTQMLNRRGGIECDFTVARLGGGALLDRHRHRLRQPRPRVDPPAPARGRARRAGPRRHLALGLLRDLGAAGPRDPRSR